MRAINRIQIPVSLFRNLSKSCPNAQLYPTEKVDEFYASALSLKALQGRKIRHHILQSWDVEEVPIEISYPSPSSLYNPPHSEAILEVYNYVAAKQGTKKRSQVLYLGRNHLTLAGYFTLDRPGGKRSYQWLLRKTPQKIADIRSLFPKIQARIRDPDTKVILGLGSGGVRLFAHCTLLKFLNALDLRSEIDEVWGSSGGAIAALTYSLGIDPSEIEEEGYHLYNERYSFRFAPSKMDVLKNFLLDSFLPTSTNSIQGLLDCQSMMKALIEKYLSKGSGRNIPFFCTAYNLDEKRSESLTPERINPNLYSQSHPIVQTDSLEAVLASSAIPILYIPKKIVRDGQVSTYIDGGTMEEVPMVSPYRKWLQDRRSGREKRKKVLFITVNLFPHMSRSDFFETWIFKRVPAFKLLHLWATYIDLIRFAHIDEHKSFVLHDRDAEVWELTLPLSVHGVVDTKIIPKVIQSAQKSFFEQLLGIEKGLG